MKAAKPAVETAESNVSVTLPPKNESLAERVNSSKEKKR